MWRSLLIKKNWVQACKMDEGRLGHVCFHFSQLVHVLGYAYDPDTPLPEKELTFISTSPIN